MKKLSILIASFALILGSCAKNEPAAGPEEGTPGTIVFDISTDGAATRGGNIVGAEAQSNVQEVVIYAFKDDGSSNFLYDQTIAFDGGGMDTRSYLGNRHFYQPQPDRRLPVPGSGIRR